MEYPLHVHPTSYSTCRIIILSTFETSLAAELFYSICSKRAAPTLPPTVTTTYCREKYSNITNGMGIRFGYFSLGTRCVQE